MMAPYLLRLLVPLPGRVFRHPQRGGPGGGRGRLRRRARRAAHAAAPAGRFLLALRLLPAALALFVVAGLCVPSYLWLEPETGPEEVGAGCLAAAILAAVLWGTSTARGRCAP